MMSNQTWYIVNKHLKTHINHRKCICPFEMYKHHVKVCIYIYEKVLQKIDPETSSEACSLLGKIIIQNPKAMRF